MSAPVIGSRDQEDDPLWSAPAGTVYPKHESHDVNSRWTNAEVQAVIDAVRTETIRVRVSAGTVKRLAEELGRSYPSTLKAFQRVRSGELTTSSDNPEAPARWQPGNS